MPSCQSNRHRLSVVCCCVCLLSPSSGNQGHLVQHRTPLVGQLHLRHMYLAMGAGSQEQVSCKCEHYQGRAKDSWHPLLLVIWWGYYLDPGLPKYIPATTQTHSSIAFHLKLLCTCSFSIKTLEQGEIIWAYRLIFCLELCDSALTLLSDECWLLQSVLKSALVCPKLPLLQSKIVPSLFTWKCLANSYTFHWFLFSWKHYWDRSVHKLKKRKAHY